jgi:plasmid replication initiation protein
MSKPKKREVILNLPKNIGAIQISNDLTLVERKIMNIILWNAFNIEKDSITKEKSFNKDNKKFYSLDISAIEDVLGWDRYIHRVDIKKSLKKLVSTSLQFNILKKQNTDNGKWNITSSLLSDVATDNDDNTNEVYYAFSHGIKDIIIKPTLYGWINLEEQKGIDSKYTLALLEYLQGSIAISRRTETKTEYIAIDDYKKLVAGDKCNYDTFKHINQKLIKAPLQELNDKTTIMATASFKKSGRKVTEISFDIKKESDNLLDHPLQQTLELDFNTDTSPNEQKYTLNEDVYQNQGNPQKSIEILLNMPQNTNKEILATQDTRKTNELMISCNISEKKRKEFLSIFSHSHIEENIKYFSKQKEWKDKPKNDIPVGLIIKAIEENYANCGAEKDEMELRTKYIFELRIMLNPYFDKTDSKFLRNVLQDYQIYKERRDKEQIKTSGLKLKEALEKIDFIIMELIRMGYTNETSILQEIGIKSDDDFERILFYSKEELKKLKEEVCDF